MKILFLNPFDKNAGSTIRLRKFFKFLEELKYDVIYVESNTDLNKDNVINVAQRNSIMGFFLGTIKRLEIMLSSKYDLLITQKLTPFTVPTILLAKLMGKKVMLDFDDWDSFLQRSAIMRYFFNLVENLSYHIPDFYTCANDRLKRLLCRKTKKPVTVVPQCMDCSLFDPNKYDVKGIKKELGFGEDTKIVGFLGYFTPGGIGEFEKLAEVMKRIVSNNDKVYFLVIGGGRLFSFYKNRYGFKNFIFTGELPHNEVPKYLSICDVVTIWMKDDIGNRYKGTLKIIEYLLMEKPVVGFLVGETKDSFGKYCFLTNNSIEDFVKTLQHVLFFGNTGSRYNATELKEKYSLENNKLLIKQVLEEIKKL